jgi:AAA family ATP:ADP antiporter
MSTHSRWRERLWPVYGKENWKFIPMLIMMALSLFNYTSLRITKDALIVTASGSGAGVLNFLKGYIVMPMAVLFVILYGMMSNRVSKKNLFYTTLLPFLVFFTLFAVFLYPFTHIIHMSPERLAQLQEIYPRLRYIIPIFGYWSYSLFYVFSELWGNVAITLLFWQFANLNTSPDEVKRFYPLFGTYSNVGLIAAGFVQRNSLDTESTCLLVVISGALLGLVYWWLNKYVLSLKEYRNEAHHASPKKDKVKLSLVDGFKLVFKSKYLGYIAILTLAYGMTANLVEITWKDKVKELYPAKKDFQSFMGEFFIATGFATMMIGFVAKNAVLKLGWKFSAMITPVVMLCTSILFYGFAIFSTSILPAALAAGSAPLIFAVIIGAIQNIASKGTKYSLFDPTKEMTYIPLDDNLRIRGKAAVDVVGGRLGKSLGGHIQSISLLLSGGSQITIAPLLMVFVTIISIWWLYAVKKLSHAYHTAINKDAKGSEKGVDHGK